jgi:hypothetical protein
MTTRNIMILVLLLVALGLGSGRGLRGQAVNAGAVGRYMLVSAEYEAPVIGKGSVEMHSLFRIDTTTGQTWEYAYTASGGKYVMKWTPLLEK